MNAKTLLSAAASGALMAMAASSAQALPTFYFNAYGGWLDGTATGFPDPAFTGIEASGSPAAGDAPQFLPAGINNNLIWGTATGNGGPFSGRSGAIINDPASLTSGIGHMQQASIEAGNLAPVLLGTLTHINEPIENVFEGDVRVRYFFDVYADAARTQFIASLDSAPFGDFLIHFNETLNAEPCQAGSVSVCDDIFSFGPANATDSFIYEGKE